MTKKNLKVIIPVAGIGSRLRPHTHTQPKALVPVAGKPILSHIIENLMDAGIQDFIFIVGYLGDKVESYVTDKYPALNTHFIELLIVLGDTIFDVNLKEVLALPTSSLGLKRVDDPRHFGVAELNAEGQILHLSEKPLVPTSNLALVGIYLIKEAKMLMDSIDYLINNNLRTQHDFHLTDALMRMIEQGVKMNTFPVENWYDCGSKENLLETNAILLKRYPPESQCEHASSESNNIIIQPVRIAANCTITNSIIGPNVSIGENTIIQSSILGDCIIGSYSQLQNAVLHQSVIGNDASLKGLSQSLNIGDNTEIDFSS
jgi:glucose-1-phosphate thymidylyltransferase